MSYQTTVAEGKMKLVSIDSDNHVSVMMEGSVTYQNQAALKKGRNRFKLVGKSCTAKNITLFLGSIEKKLLTYRFSSVGEEKAYLFMNEIKAGKPVDIQKLKDCAAYLEDEDLETCMAILQSQKDTNLTIEDLLSLAPFLSEDSLGNYLALILKQENTALSIDDISKLAPFLDDDMTADCVKQLLKLKNVTL